MFLLEDRMTEQQGEIVPGDQQRGELVADGGTTFCVACGKEHSATADVCPHCGHGSTDDTPEDDADSLSSQNPESVTSTASDPDPVTDTEPSAANGPVTDTATESHRAEKRRKRATDTTAQSSSPAHRTTTASSAGEYCPNCGEPISASANHCPHCGASKSDSGKSPLLAGLLSFLIVGVGHVYAGELQRGVGFFVGAVGAWIGAEIVVGEPQVVVLAVWVYAAYDAYKIAS